jgi:hypothetical protein
MENREMHFLQVTLPGNCFREFHYFHVPAINGYADAVITRIVGNKVTFVYRFNSKSEVEATKQAILSKCASVRFKPFNKN